MLKSRIYIGTHLLMILMLMIRILVNSTDTYDYNDYGNFVGEMTLIIHVVFLIFMVFFYLFLSNEYRYGSEQLFVGTVKITVLKLLALLVNHFIILLIFTTIQAFIVLSYFYIETIKFSSFYIDTIMYIFYYWFTPSILACFIGVFLALSFGRKHLTFLIIIAIWLIFGPMNTVFFYNFFYSLSEGDIGNLLFLYPLNNADVYRDLVGYNLNFSSLLANLVWILIISSFIVFFLIKGSHTRKVQFTGLIIGISLIITAFGIVPYALKGKIPVFNYKQMIEEATYAQNQTPEIQEDLLAYNIRMYDISINMKNNHVQAIVEVDLDLWHEDLKDIAFSLYHSMRIKHIKNNKGENIEFSQRGDFVIIHEPVHTITFEYIMEDSALLPASNNYLFLPYYINWIPKRTNHPQLIVDESIHEERIIVSNQEPADYKLEIKGIDNYYTNLSKMGKHIHSGEQVKGVSLIAGAIQKEKLEDSFLVYPLSWPDVKENWKEYYGDLKETHLYLNDMFKLDKSSIPEDIVFLTPNLKYDSFLSSDHLLIHQATLYELGEAVHEIPEMYIPGILWNNARIDDIDPGLIEVFNQMLKNLLLEEIEYNTTISHGSMFDIYPSKALRRYGDIHALGIDIFYKNYSNMSPQERKNFLIKWYENFTTIRSWDDATSFMENFIKENM